MITSQTNSPRTVSEVISTARAAQKMTLEQFAAALGVNSKQNIFNWEKGVNEPGEIISAWFTDEREWVAQLAEDIFVARYRQSLQAAKRTRQPIATPA